MSLILWIKYQNNCPPCFGGCLGWFVRSGLFLWIILSLCALFTLSYHLHSTDLCTFPSTVQYLGYQMVVKMVLCITSLHPPTFDLLYDQVIVQVFSFTESSIRKNLLMCALIWSSASLIYCNVCKKFKIEPTLLSILCNMLLSFDDYRLCNFFIWDLGFNFQVCSKKLKSWNIVFVSLPRVISWAHQNESLELISNRHSGFPQWHKKDTFFEVTNELNIGIDFAPRNTLCSNCSVWYKHLAQSCKLSF